MNYLHICSENFTRAYNLMIFLCEYMNAKRKQLQTFNMHQKPDKKITYSKKSFENA